VSKRWLSQFHSDLSRHGISTSQAVGRCATRCDRPERIVQSGIIQVLLQLQKEKGEQLTTIHVEFLQICIYAKEYAFAEEQIRNTWPRPSKESPISALSVLRYFYLRGIVHIGTNNLVWANRCFWTCICIPTQTSTVISTISIAAWKKMMLVQCLQLDYYTPTPNLPRMPAEVAHGLSQYLKNATETSRKSLVEVSTEDVADDPMDVQEPAQTSFPNLGVPCYTQLVDAFARLDRKRFNATINQAVQLFTADGNNGLVQRIGEVFTHRRLYHLGSVYSALSVEQFENKMKVPNALAVLRGVSVEKSWPVYIEDECIRFPPNGPGVPRSSIAQAHKDLASLKPRLQTLLNESVSLQAKKDDSLSAVTGRAVENND